MSARQYPEKSTLIAVETYGGAVRKKIGLAGWPVCPRCAHNHASSSRQPEMASRQLNISSFFFKKPADAVEDAAPAVGGAALKRKIPASDEPNAPPDETRASLPDRHDRATKSARTSSPPASSDKENEEEEDADDVVVRIPSADDRDPVRREALARALGAASSDETKRADVQRRFRFLDPALVRDDRGRRPSHPEYDERTCSIPAELKLSASQRQYWEIKSKYRDVVLFFKVGKFYELYEDDAEIGCRELDWKMTVSGVGHCRQVGCPEAGVDAACARLVHLGHKVGRIEQLETAAQAKARGGSNAVIRRALAEVSTPATRTDGDVGDDAVAAPDATHIIAFAEEEDEEILDAGGDEKGEQEDEVGTKKEDAFKRAGSRAAVGYSFLDAAAGTIHLGVLPPDDEHGTALATLLAQVSPAEVLVRRGRVSDVARRELVKCAAKPRVTALTAGEEFPVGAASADRALGRAASGASGTSGSWRWASSATVAGARPVARACAAAVVAHLSRLNCSPIIAGLEASTKPHDVYAHGRVRMDACTMTNLELILGAEGTAEGSLLRRISFGCSTDAGRRTMRRWIAAPLRDVGAIRERQDAVWCAAESGSVIAEAVETATRGLRGAPDLERAVGRARAARNAGLAGLKFASLPPHLARPRHARRVAALAAAAAAVRRAWTVTNDFATAIGDDDSKRQEMPALFRRFVEAGRFEASALDTVDDVFREVTRSSVGDDSKASSSVKKPLKAFGASLASSRDPGGDDHDASEAIRDADEVCTALLERFLEHSGSWVAAAAACAELDAVSSLAAFARDGGASQPMCRPVFVTRGDATNPNGGDPVFDAKDLWHPCAVVSSMASGDSADGVIPNDVALGCEDPADPSAPPAMLLTGPNMGGKSTLLRATCVAVVLAQMGAPVPASSCALSPADAIFARLGGAGDRIHAGESTFLVECAEASAILRGATRDSIVALDELGRGTSTFDGYAVAHASLEHLAHSTRCRVMFATHYHGLSREFLASPLVQLRHMAAHVADEAVGDMSDKKSDKPSDKTSDAPITFLYKLRKGACPKSYGMKVASLAGMPREIVRRAEEVAAAMETSLASVFGGVSDKTSDKKSAFGRDGDALTVGEKLAVDAIVKAIDAEDQDALMRLWTGLRERMGMA